MINTSIESMINNGEFIPTAEYSIGTDNGEDLDFFFDQLEAMRQGWTD